MHKTYRDIAAHVNGQLPEIAWTDRDKEQLNNPGKFNSILTPGLLLGFSEVDWDGQNKGQQIGYAALTARLIFPLPPSTYETGGIWDAYEGCENLSSKLHEALQRHPGIGARRTSRDYYTGSFYVCEQVFDLTVNHTKPIKTIPKPPPLIDGAISTTIKLPIT